MRILKKKDFSNGEISKVLHIKHDRVTDFLEDEKNVEKNISVKKSNRTGDQDPHDNDDQPGEPGNTDESNSKLQGSGNGNSESEQINFIGGNDMSEKTSEGETEKTYYKCFNCGFESETPFDVCPKCDKENNFN